MLVLIGIAVVLESGSGRKRLRYRDPLGTETLAEVKSRWCCLDADTLQSARLLASTVECFCRS